VDILYQWLSGIITMPIGVTDCFESEYWGNLTPTGTGTTTPITKPWHAYAWDDSVTIATDPVYVCVAASTGLTRVGPTSATLTTFTPGSRVSAPTWSAGSVTGLTFSPNPAETTTVTNSNVSTGQEVPVTAQVTKQSPFSGTLSATAKVDVVDVNIVSSAVDEAHETTTAVLVPVLAETASSGGVPVSLSVAPTMAGTATLEKSSSNFDVYNEATLSTVLLGSTQTTATCSVPKTVYIKGVTASANDTLTLSFTPSAQTGGSAPPEFKDEIKLNVIKVDIAAFDRVPPTKTKQVVVTTIPSPLPAGCSISLVCETDAGTTGSATVSPTTINQTTTVTITGVTQSWGSGENAAPNNIKLRAKLGSFTCAEEPFTVCAHLVDFTCSSGPQNLNYGLKVYLSWQSETGSACDNLDRCDITEWLTYSDIPNPPFCETDGSKFNKSGTSERFPPIPILGNEGDGIGAADEHRHPATCLTNPPGTGSYTVDQIYEYRCNRCNSGWQSLATYTITYEIYDADPGEGTNLKFHVQKIGQGKTFSSDEDVPGF
jgi:hypothetical protein